MSITLDIRKGSLSELPEIMTVVNLCMHKLRAQNITQWDDLYPTDDQFKADLQAHNLFVALHEGEIIGTISIATEQPPEYQTIAWHHSGKVVTVHRLCVNPEWWGQGIASSLMDYVENWAFAQTYSGMRLDTYSDNHSAIRLYDSRSYRLAGKVFFPRRAKPFYCFEKNLYAN